MKKARFLTNFQTTLKVLLYRLMYQQSRHWKNLNTQNDKSSIFNGRFL